MQHKANRITTHYAQIKKIQKQELFFFLNLESMTSCIHFYLHTFRILQNLQWLFHKYIYQKSEQNISIY